MKCSGVEDRMGRYMLGSRRLLQRWRAFHGLSDVDVDDVEMEGVGSGERSIAQKWSLSLCRFSIWFGVRVIESIEACSSMGSMAASWSRRPQKPEMERAVDMFGM
jgi:hypothetical protein